MPAPPTDAAPPRRAAAGAPYHLIDDGEALAEYLSQVPTAPWAAVDTEFVRERTYFPLLCLVQVAIPGRVAVVDALAVDVQPLWEALERLPADKVLHAAGQDLEIWVQQRGRVPHPLFDSQVAAALLGYGDQLAYAGLVEALLGIKLDKSLTRTDWSVRPLSAAALAYAAADVFHLGQMYPQLVEALQQRQRLGWLREECARISDPALYRTQPAEAWRRLRGLSRLAPTEQPLAMALAAWRERQAIASNRPRRWILDDEAVLTLAQRRPQTRNQLAELEVVPPKTLQRHGDALLAAMTEAEAYAPPTPPPAPLDATQKARFERLRHEVADLATRLEIPAALLTTRSELEALARDAAARVRIREGWRAQFAGELSL